MRAESYGFPGMLVDGTDSLAVYQATREAVDRARAGGGPTLIEARSIRMMPHSSADDHLLYRTQDELDRESIRDPILRWRNSACPYQPKLSQRFRNWLLIRAGLTENG